MEPYISLLLVLEVVGEWGGMEELMFHILGEDVCVCVEGDGEVWGLIHLLRATKIDKILFDRG